ncbi:MAG: serine/threonine-protein kinase [bacterium]
METQSLPKILHYDLIEELGRSRHGVTWRAYDTGLQRVVVLKLFGRPEEEAHAFAWRYLPMLESARQLSHPNLGTIFDAREYRRAILIVSEYQEGLNLEQYVRKQAVSLHRFLELAVQLARGLNHIHRHQLTHGNLKPSNVIIGPDGILRILDCGLPLLVPERSESIDDVPTAELAYVPPECLDGQRPGQLGDFYSAGVLFYETLTGLRLYDAPDREGLLELIRREQPDYDVLRAQGFPGDIVLLVEQLLAGAKSGRCSNFDELLVTLKSIDEFEREQVDIPQPLHKSHSSRSYLILSGIAVVLFIIWITLTTIR